MSRERAQALLTEHFGPFGSLDFPYVKMGNIDSLHLFGDTELMIFAIYWHNRSRWKHGADIGANLGLHTILMSKIGMTVECYEPDPVHYKCMARNLEANDCHGVEMYQCAVHTSTGSAPFVRVLHNLTGNHLEGYKNSYGPRETITVETIDVRQIWEVQPDIVKMDCEGNEAELLQTLEDNIPNIIVEVRNRENASAIYNHLSRKIPMWSQKKGWERVLSVDDMPMQNRDGSLFIGYRGPFA